MQRNIDTEIQKLEADGLHKFMSMYTHTYIHIYVCVHIQCHIHQLRLESTFPTYHQHVSILPILCKALS